MCDGDKLYHKFIFNKRPTDIVVDGGGAERVKRILDNIWQPWSTFRFKNTPSDGPLATVQVLFY